MTQDHGASSPLRLRLAVEIGGWVTDNPYLTPFEAIDGILAGRFGLSLGTKRWKLGYRGRWWAHLFHHSLTHHQQQLRGHGEIAWSWGKMRFGGRFVWRDFAGYFSTSQRVEPRGQWQLLLAWHRRFRVGVEAALGYQHFLRRPEARNLLLAGGLWARIELPSGTDVEWKTRYRARHFASLAAGYPTQGSEDLGEASRGQVGPLEPRVDGQVRWLHRLLLQLRVEQTLGPAMSLWICGQWWPGIQRRHRFKEPLARMEPAATAELHGRFGGEVSVGWSLQPQMWRGSRLELWGKLSDFRYGGHAARGASGAPLWPRRLRSDLGWSIGASAQWRLPFAAPDFFGKGIFLRASYAFQNSRSNDAYSSYHRHLGYLGVGTSW